MRANKKLITHKPPNPCVISEIDVGTRKYIVDPKRSENIAFDLWLRLGQILENKYPLQHKLCQSACV